MTGLPSGRHRNNSVKSLCRSWWALASLLCVSTLGWVFWHQQTDSSRTDSSRMSWTGAGTGTSAKQITQTASDNDSRPGNRGNGNVNKNSEVFDNGRPIISSTFDKAAEENADDNHENKNGDNQILPCCYHQSLAVLMKKFKPGYFERQTRGKDANWTGDEYEEWMSLAGSPLLQPTMEDNTDTKQDQCEVEWQKVVLNDVSGKHLRNYLNFLEGTEETTFFRYMEDTPELPRILYLGDSISLNTWPITQDLYATSNSYGDKLANIHSAPNNCGGFENYEKSLTKWLGDCPWDLIQFNVGAHFHPDEETGLGPYERGLITVIERLLEHSPNAHVVLATTTPSPFDSPETLPSRETCKDYNLLHKAGVVPSMNEVARKVAAQYENVVINDRYEAVYDSLHAYQKYCNIHFESGGYQLLARQDWKVASGLLGLEDKEIPILEPEVEYAEDSKDPNTAISCGDELTTNNDEKVDLSLQGSSTTWPGVREQLCPLGVPNVSLGRTLFAMARQQLGVNTTQYEEVQEATQKFRERRPDLAVSTRFFEGGQFQNASIFQAGSSRSVVYVPIWKAANMAIRRWMKNVFDESSEGELIEYRLGDYFQSSSSSSSSNERAKASNMEDSCIVTAIRDPISHFLSGYNECEFRRGNVPEAKRKFATRYFDMPIQSATDRYSRFEQFVYDLLLEDARGWQIGVYNHVFSMSRVLTELNQIGGRRLTAYIPSLDHVSTDFPAMVKNKCSFALSEQQRKHLHPINTQNGKHKSSEDPEGFYQAAKDVWAGAGPVAKALCVLHAVDYACWEELSDGVPEVCQTVFDSPEFTEHLLA